MRAKYKIGTLVQVPNPDIEGEFSYGVVTAIITRADGYSYRVGESEEFTDTQIANGFRPIATRAAKVQRKTKGSPKKRSATSEAALEQ